jgi:hypothetical protein
MRGIDIVSRAICLTGLKVLFEIDDKRVTEIYRCDGVSRGFFIIPGNIGDYVSIRVVMFLNVQ